MSRRLRTKLPVVKSQLLPVTYDLANIRRRLDAAKEKQKRYHDRHAAEDLPVLLPGDPVRMQIPDTKDWLPATVVEHHSSPRSYSVECNGRKYRRNRKFLRLSTYRAHTQHQTQQNAGKQQSVLNFETMSCQKPAVPPQCISDQSIASMCLFGES